MILRPQPRSSLFPYTTLFRSAPGTPRCRFVYRCCGTLRNGSRVPRATRAESSPRRRSLPAPGTSRSEEHTSELQSPCNLVCRLLLEKKKENIKDGEGKWTRNM